ncbi:MAG TPA: hypothetical protein PLW13_02145 [Pseudomonadales bacterium]|jgi:flavorubredoxin|nr:hypothetical protein [Pseudomonadales bacterium]
MSVTNHQSGTNVHEVADGIYSINTPVQLEGGVGFSFNQHLVLDDEPLLFHTGPRRMFALVREAVAHVMPVERLRYLAFSHVEADECGALNERHAAVRRPVHAGRHRPAAAHRVGHVDFREDRERSSDLGR